MKKKILTLIIMFLVLSCNDSKYIEYPTDNLNLKKPEVFIGRDFVDSLSFVNLEMTKNSMFSFLDKIMFRNDKIYVFDRTGKNHVYVFSNTGKFISKVGSIGKGPQEYNRIRDFDLDRNNNILLYDYQRQIILKYNEYGVFTDVFSIKHLRADAFKVMKNGDFLFSIMKEDPKSTLIDYHLVITDPDFKIINKIIPMDSEFKDNYFAMNYLMESLYGITYCKPPNPIIYSFDKKGTVLKKMVLNFEEPIPNDLVNDSSIQNEYNNDSFETLIFRPVLTNRYIFGNSTVQEYGNQQRSFFLYDIKNNTFYRNILGSDTFSHKNINFPILSVKDSIIVSYMEQHMLEYDLDKEELPDEVRRHLLNSGFVLVKYHLKKQQ